jgi:hypothetical protein
MLSLIALQASKELYSTFSRIHRMKIKVCLAMLRAQLRELPIAVKEKACRSCYYH